MCNNAALPSGHVAARGPRGTLAGFDKGQLTGLTQSTYTQIYPLPEIFFSLRRRGKKGSMYNVERASTSPSAMKCHVSQAAHPPRRRQQAFFSRSRHTGPPTVRASSSVSNWIERRSGYDPASPAVPKLR